MFDRTRQVLRLAIAAGRHAMTRLALIFSVLLASSLDAAEQLPGGQLIYISQCAECHGDKGQGVEDAYEDPLHGGRSLVGLTKIIHDTMPEGEAELCAGPQAQRVAEFIFGTFYTEQARARHQPPRIALARLTARQYLNTATDLIGSFVGQGKLDDRRGLNAQYFKARNFAGDKKVFERVDPQVNFDFGQGSPDAERIKPEEFSVRWQGGLIAEDTGDYEICLNTENGARLWLNSEQTPLVDAWVKSGDQTEHRATIRLLGGRVYPIRIEFFKFKDKTASIALRWRPPQRVLEPVPERNLAPGWFPPLLVVTTDFPADDSSQGYERGTSVSPSWDRATTYAAVEIANRVVEHLDALSKCKSDAPDRRERLKQFCYQFAERAFRRPLTHQQKRTFVDAQFEIEPELDAAVKRVVLLVLKSPRFLYLGIGEVDDYEVASRLSLGLWDSLPDKPLLEAAVAGRLGTPEEVAAQARRMLADRRAWSKLRYFLHTWLKVEHFADISKDKEAFPEFDAAVLSDLRTSLDLFLKQTLWGETPDFQRLLLAEELFLNRRLATFYGVDGPEDGRFELVACDPAQRVGVLTHPLLMTGFAYHKSTSPIHRGVFMVRGMLGRSLKPPPIAVAPLDEGVDPNLSTRERVALQTKPEMCQSCHSMINPLGFALENYDAVGRFRNDENGKPVDASGSYKTVSGEQAEFNGARQLGQYLAGSEEVHRCFVGQLFHHAVKQPITAYGPEQLPNLTEFFAAADFDVREVLVEIMKTSALATNKE